MATKNSGTERRQVRLAAGEARRSRSSTRSRSQAKLSGKRSRRNKPLKAESSRMTTPSATRQKGKSRQPSLASTCAGITLRAALSQGQPGSWASDHREEAAHFTGWNYVAINAVAKQASQADLAVYEDGHRPQAKSIRKSLWRQGVKAYGNESTIGNVLPADAPLMQLFSRPNPTQSGAALRYEQVMQLMLTGTCLIWKVPNQVGLTCERYVIPTAIAYPVEPSQELPRGGWRIDPAACRWRYAGFQDGEGFADSRGYSLALGRIIPAENMQVIRWSHPIWKDDGYSALAAGAKIIDSAEQVDSSRFSSLRNSSNPSLVISVPPEFDPTDEQLDAIATKFNAKYAGTDNDGKAIFVTGGGEVIKLNTNPKEMDFVQAFTQLRDAVLALHGVPGIAAGITDGGSYAAFYASLKQFTTLTVQPILDLLAEEDTEQIAPQFGPGLTVELTAAAIDDPDVLERQLQTDLQAGIRTRGELRALRGLPPFGDERDNEIAGQPQAAVQVQESEAVPPTAQSTGRSRSFPDLKSLTNGWHPN